MRKLWKKWKPFLFFTLPLAPLIIAFIGYSGYYSQENKVLHPFWDTLYSAIRIYGASLDIPLNAQVGVSETTIILLEIARWSAILVIGSAVIKLLQKTIRHFHTRLVAWNKHSVALYGDPALVVRMKAELGVGAIASTDSARFHAANHVLAFRETSAMYDFLNTHYQELLSRKGARLFLYSANPIHPAVLNPNIYVHNIAEACSRIYWKKNWLRSDETRIALIGFGDYGQYLLTQALEVNVFLSRSAVEYHVFGNADSYNALHPGLSQIVDVNQREAERDAVFFHAEPWYIHLDILKDMDRIILCMDDDNEIIRLIDALLRQNVRGRVYARISNENLLRALGQTGLDNKPNVIPFGTDQELYSLDQITNATTLSKGRLIHASYCRAQCPQKRPEKCGELVKCLECDLFQQKWNNASAYDRASSIAQADHIPVKIREILHVTEDDVNPLAEKAFAALDAMDEEQKKQYMALEHRRWMRFMYMHGWTYAGARDNLQRKHPLLIPFEELPPKEQSKDMQAYEILSEVAAYDHFKKEMLHHV